MAVDTTQSWQEHTSDGSTAYFPFNFNYDTTRPGTIVVGKRTADNTYSVVDASNYELIPNASGDGGQIRFIQNPSGSQVIDDIPPAGTIVRIERVSVDTSSATWQIGLEMSELVNLFDRLFRLVQENKGGFDNVIKTFETQHNVSLYELLSTHNNHLLYWDNTTQTLTPTDFPKEDVVRCVNGLFFRISTDTAGNPYLEWSLTGTDNWHSVSDTAVEALSKINNHLADKNNPHETSMSKLTDTEITNLSANQFIMFDGMKWKNVFSSATVYWGQVLGNITDQTDLMNKFTEYVRTDGTSVMTAPLKFKAGSMRGAVGPYLNGVSFWKLDSQGNITNIANLTDSQFLPVTTNSIDLGNTTHTWKDLYVARVITAVINNGYDIAVPVTNSADTLALLSDIAFKSTDVELTTPSAGQFLRYNGTKWVNSSDSYADTNLSNLTSTGKNIANWSSNVSNCITEIPQDIKLELNNGTLTVKAGTVYYVPNGAGVFTKHTLSVDETVIPGSANSEYFIFISNNGDTSRFVSYSVYSGATAPTVSGTAVWYDTTNNEVKYTSDSGSTWIDGWSLPVAVCTPQSGSWVSIDNVFNGFGYVGSTVFALPGVKGLAPNGRNIDGTLKNAERTATGVSTISSSATGTFYVAITSSGEIAWSAEVSRYVYDESTNWVIDTQTGSANTNLLATIVTLNSGSITSFTPKTAFHAVDYNDAAIKAGNNTFTGSNEFKETVKAPRVYGYGSDGVRTASLEFIDGGNDNIARLVAVSNNGNNAATADLHFNNGSPYFSVPSSDAVNAAVATLAKTKAQNGYFKLSNGLIIQWGSFDASTTGQAITFPTAFTSASSYSLAFSYDSTVNTGGNVQDNCINTRTTTGFTTGAVSRTGSAMWIAIGY